MDTERQRACSVRRKMKLEPNKKAMAKLEKSLTKTVAVPTKGSDTAAAAAVKRDYEKQTGVKLSADAARRIAKQARSK
jgi:hypothetical protein